MSEILFTKNYEQFNKMDGFRKVSKKHVKNLKKVIEEYNLLAVYPIIVNKDFYVIDGQHRLQAAKELEIDIYYIRSENVKDDHYFAANTVLKRKNDVIYKN